MPDVLGWVKQDGSVPHIDSLVSWGLMDALKEAVAQEMTVHGDLARSEIYRPGQVDVLSLQPLLSSQTKKFVLHIYAHPHKQRMANLPKRLETIASRIKEFDEHFSEPGCVAVSFKVVECGGWVKA